MKIILALIFSTSAFAKVNAECDNFLKNELSKVVEKHIEKYFDIPSIDELRNNKELIEASPKLISESVDASVSKIAVKPAVQSNLKSHYADILTKHFKKDFNIPTLNDFVVLAKTSIENFRKLNPDMPADTRKFKEYIFNLVKDDAEIQQILDDNLNSFLKVFIKKHYRLPVGPLKLEFAETMGVSKPELKIFYPDLAKTPAEQAAFYFKQINKNVDEFAAVRKDILNKYSGLAKLKLELPEQERLAKYLEISNDELGYFFGEGRFFKDAEDIRNQAMEMYPERFVKVKDTLYFTDAKRQLYFDEVKSKRVHIITSAVAGAAVHEALGGLISYKNARNGTLAVLAMEKMITYLDDALYRLDMNELFIVDASYAVLPDVNIIDGQITAKQINGLTGFQRVGPRFGYNIMPSTKIAVETVRTAENGKRPLQYLLTGTITGENYYTAGLGRTIQMRTNTIAQYDHTIGAVVVEIDDSVASKLGAKTYPQVHVRHIKYDKQLGGFVDKGKLYKNDGTIVDLPKSRALVFGDVHGTKMREKLGPAMKNAIMSHEFDYMMIHDGFDGSSIPHHSYKNKVAMNKMAQGNKLSLLDEVAQFIALYDSMLSLKPDFQMVFAPSNHDFWVSRFATESWYQDDTMNYHVADFVKEALRAGVHPLEYFYKYGDRVGIAQGQFPERVRFLKHGEPFKLTNGKKGAALKEMHLGYHGDNGMWGRTVSLKSLQQAAVSAIVGHGHPVQMRVSNGNRDTIMLGAMTTDAEYAANSFSNVGASYALVDANLNAQVFQNGYLLDTFMLNDEMVYKPVLYPSQYPKVMEEFEMNKSYDLDNGGGADQYRDVKVESTENIKK
ncbi:MAG: hypothetical protein JNM93_07530 [Bacteriovoracaceae bacterium]|nr:hypothetical protein [Bacteriovoracaceae bacterium]